MPGEKGCRAGKPVPPVYRQADAARLTISRSRQWADWRLAVRVGDLFLSPMENGLPWLALAAQLCQNVREEGRRAR